MQQKTWRQRVVDYRAKADITQEELARRMGVSRFTVIRWELGKTPQPERRHDAALSALERAIE